MGHRFHVLVLGLWVIAGVSCTMGRGTIPSPSISPAVMPTETPLPSPASSPPTEAVEGKPTPPGGETPVPFPPTPTLPSLSTDWTTHEFPEIGVRLRAPREWEVLRMPGGYVLSAGGDYRLSVGTCCVELPHHTLEAFQEALVPYWQNLHAEGFQIVSLHGNGWEGVGIWHLPNTCLDVYIPVPTEENVRLITFFSALCEAGGDRLTPLGEVILASVEIFPPQGAQIPGP